MRSLSELKTHNSIEEDEIDLRELWRTIVRKKYIIVSIAFCIFFLSIVYVFLSKNIYSTYSLIEISEKSTTHVATDLDIFSGDLIENSELPNEIEIVKSREMLLKLLSSLPLNIRYYNDGLFEKNEIYEKKPVEFIINNIAVKLDSEITFNVKLIDEKYFSIEAQSPEGSAFEWELEGKYKFGETIKASYFDLLLQPTQYFTLDECNCRIVYEADKNVFIDNFIRPNLSVGSLSKEASIMKVAFNDAISQRGVDLVNTLVSVYFDEKISYQKEEVGEKLKFVNKQLKVTYDNLSKSQIQIKDFKQTNTIATIPNSSLTLLNTLVDVDTQLQQVDMRLNVLEGLLEQIKLGNTAAISIDALGIAGSSMHSIIMSLQQKTATRKALLNEFTSKHPDVMQITGEITALKHSLRDSIESLYASTKKQKSDLEATKKTYEGSLGDMPSKELGLMNLSRDFEVNQKMYLYLLEKKAEFEILNAATIPKSRILDRAIVYPQPVKPKKMLIVAVGLILGLILGISVAFVLEFIDDKIITPDDIERITDIPIYGVVPEKKVDESAFEESMNMIRTNMEFISAADKNKTIMISSNIPEEGKTTIAVNLSKTLAKAGKKVLLIDIDMRKFKLIKEFPKANAKVGMSDLLAGNAEIGEAVVNVEEHLDIIFSGKIPPNPSELLFSPRIEEIVTDLKKSYDYIIIDTAPIGLVTDAMILLKKNIHSLFLVIARSEVTDRGIVANLNKLVHKHRLHSVGIILNGLNIQKAGYYGYGYGYGYSVETEED